MTDIYTIIKRLEKGNRVEENLALFSNHMMKEGNRLSYIRFALNYPTFHEVIGQLNDQKAQLPPIIQDSIQELNRILKFYLESDFSGETMEVFLSEIDRLRQKNIDTMHLLTAYTDRYTIYEYVLNRVEYQFKQGQLENGYSDEQFKNRIIAFLTSDKDSSMRQMRTVQILEQLPMRMTKGRFLQIVEDGLSAYIGSDKETVTDLLFMIRTAAMMEEPKGLQELYPELYQMIEQMAKTDFSGLTGEDYNNLMEGMKTGFQTLNQDMDICMLLEELTNDLYVIMLSDPYAISDIKEKENCQAIIRTVSDAFEREDYAPIAERVLERLQSLEGIQETACERFQAGESILDEIDSAYSNLLPGVMLDKIYYAIHLMSKLLSSSIYMELEEKKGTETVSRSDIIQTSARLAAELKSHLKKQPKAVSRAIMAKVLTLLPMFLTTYQELEEYILASLSSCTDQVEKLACVEIINGIIEE